MDKKEKSKGLNPIQILVLHIIIIVAVIWLIFGFILGVKYAPNDDMSPNIKSGDMILYYRLASEYKAQDVVVLRKNDTEYVCRIIAGPGDVVEINESEGLIINGNVVNERNIYTSTSQYEGFVEYPVHLNEGEFFVLADQRDGGEDSRYFGTIKKSEIKGRSLMIIRRNGI